MDPPTISQILQTKNRVIATKRALSAYLIPLMQALLKENDLSSICQILANEEENLDDAMINVIVSSGTLEKLTEKDDVFLSFFLSHAIHREDLNPVFQTLLGITDINYNLIYWNALSKGNNTIAEFIIETYKIEINHNYLRISNYKYLTTNSFNYLWKLDIDRDLLLRIVNNYLMDDGNPNILYHVIPKLSSVQLKSLYSCLNLVSTTVDFMLRYQLHPIPDSHLYKETLLKRSFGKLSYDERNLIIYLYDPNENENYPLKNDKTMFLKKNSDKLLEFIIVNNKQSIEELIDELYLKIKSR